LEPPGSGASDRGAAWVRKALRARQSCGAGLSAALDVVDCGNVKRTAESRMIKVTAIAILHRHGVGIMRCTMLCIES